MSAVAPDHEPLSNSPIHLRGTHLYLVLDDIAENGPENIVGYVEDLVVSKKIVESVFVKGAMARDAGRIPEHLALSVFQALSRLTMMERLEVSGDGRFGGLFLPVQAMSIVLKHRPQKLVSLRLGNVILTSRNPTAALRNADMQALAQSLRKLPCLTTIDLVRCRSETLAEGQAVTLQPIVQAISSMPKLQQAMFCETSISPAGTGLYLGELCKSRSIQKLWWKGMPGMNDTHIELMAKLLLTNTTLRELTIRSHGLGQTAGEAIANLLRQNTTLQVINLDLDQGEYGLVLAEALKTNTSLQCLDVWAWNGEENSSTITQAFTEMLRCNTLLKFLTFQGLDWNNPQVDFYLRLNRAGRQHLLRWTENRRLWAEALIKHKEDFGLIYHLLSLNPSILSNCSSVESKRNPATFIGRIDQRRTKKTKVSLV